MHICNQLRLPDAAQGILNYTMANVLGAADKISANWYEKLCMYSTSLGLYRKQLEVRADEFPISRTISFATHISVRWKSHTMMAGGGGGGVCVHTWSDHGTSCIPRENIDCSQRCFFHFCSCLEHCCGNVRGAHPSHCVFGVEWFFMLTL